MFFFSILDIHSLIVLFSFNPKFQECDWPKGKKEEIQKCEIEKRAKKIV
ncbi:unnamed protein product [Larinioides sclopetarius]|uniref:Uncharacterized protein n=1 Tax=Larinioides sclopetarius TaxID=280406 RepID=A0AAV2AR73_9ARAC